MGPEIGGRHHLGCSNVNESTKGTSLRGKTSYDAKIVKVGPSVTEMTSY